MIFDFIFFDLMMFMLDSYSLLDENLNPVAQIGILKFPLFTFNGTQMKLNLDLVSAYGFSIQGYEPHIK